MHYSTHHCHGSQGAPVFKHPESHQTGLTSVWKMGSFIPHTFVPPILSMSCREYWACALRHDCYLTLHRGMGIIIFEHALCHGVFYIWQAHNYSRTFKMHYFYCWEKCNNRNQQPVSWYSSSGVFFVLSFLYSSGSHYKSFIFVYNFHFENNIFISWFMCIDLSLSSHTFCRRMRTRIVSSQSSLSVLFYLIKHLSIALYSIIPAQSFSNYALILRVSIF